MMSSAMVTRVGKRSRMGCALLYDAGQPGGVGSGKVGPQPTLGSQDQITALASGTTATGHGSHPVSQLTDIVWGIGNGGGKTHMAQGREVNQIIAHIAYLFDRELRLMGDFLETTKFIADILVYNGNAQLAGAARDDIAFPAGNERHGNAALFEQAQAVPIKCMKTLEELALRPIPELTVGQHAVDIKGHHAHGTQAFDQLFLQRGQ